MPDLYVFLKWLHVLGAVVLFGTGVGTAFHFWMANRSQDVHAIAVAARTTMIADYAFTLPAVILQPATGFAMAILAGFPLASSWIAISFALYLLAGACWIPVVVMQIRMTRLALAAARDGTPLDDDYRRLYARWFALGWPAFIALVIVFWLMVAKPA